MLKDSIKTIPNHGVSSNGSSSRSPSSRSKCDLSDKLTSRRSSHGRTGPGKYSGLSDVLFAGVEGVSRRRSDEFDHAAFLGDKFGTGSISTRATKDFHDSACSNEEEAEAFQQLVRATMQNIAAAKGAQETADEQPASPVSSKERKSRKSKDKGSSSKERKKDKDKEEKSKKSKKKTIRRSQSHGLIEEGGGSEELQKEDTKKKKKEMRRSQSDANLADKKKPAEAAPTTAAKASLRRVRRSSVVSRKEIPIDEEPCSSSASNTPTGRRVTRRIKQSPATTPTSRRKTRRRSSANKDDNSNSNSGITTKGTTPNSGRSIRGRRSISQNQLHLVVGGNGRRSSGTGLPPPNLRDKDLDEASLHDSASTCGDEATLLQLPKPEEDGMADSSREHQVGMKALVKTYMTAPTLNSMPKMADSSSSLSSTKAEQPTRTIDLGSLDALERRSIGGKPRSSVVAAGQQPKSILLSSSSCHARTAMDDSSNGLDSSSLSRSCHTTRTGAGARPSLVRWQDEQEHQSLESIEQRLSARKHKRRSSFNGLLVPRQQQQQNKDMVLPMVHNNGNGNNSAVATTSRNRRSFLFASRRSSNNNKKEQQEPPKEKMRFASLMPKDKFQDLDGDGADDDDGSSDLDDYDEFA